MKKATVGKNYIYYLSSQIVALLVPLITTPYLSRVLGPDKIGDVSYTVSIVDLIMVTCGLGSSVFAMRQIAYCEGSKSKQSKVFFNILALKGMLAIPGILFFVCLVILYKDYSSLFLSESLILLSSLFSLDWFFSGKENFATTVIRGIAIKLLNVACIFLFVNSENDVHIYAFILGATLLLGAGVLWFPALKEVNYVRPDFDTIKQYLKGAALLFLPQIASSIYLFCDKILLGLLTEGSVQNGYYEQTQKIIRLSTTVITALPTVMLPRISAVFKSQKRDEIFDYMQKSLSFVYILGFPMVIGIMMISGNFVPWFMGEQFAPVSFLLKITSPIILFNALYNVIGYQYLIAVRKEKVMAITLLCGALTNVVLNTILIPNYGAAGASVASVVAEMLVAVLQLTYLKREMRDIRIWNSSLGRSVAAAALMGVCVFIAEIFIPPVPWGTVAILVFASLLYFSLMWLMKDRLVRELTKRVLGNVFKRRIDDSTEMNGK